MLFLETNYCTVLYFLYSVEREMLNMWSVSLSFGATVQWGPRPTEKLPRNGIINVAIHSQFYADPRSCIIPVFKIVI